MRLLLSIFMLLVTTIVMHGAAPKWEEVNNPPVEVVMEAGESDTAAHSTVKDGYVYITTTEPITVKVFTILGQLISSEKIPAGTHRLKINARGIYILKIGGTTRRITI